MADFRAIMVLLFRGRSYREIVETVGCSHRDVSAARKVIGERGLTAASLELLSAADLAGMFPDGRSRVSDGYLSPEFGATVASMRANPHFTLLQAWRGYVGSSSPLRRYAYSQYCHLFGQFAVRNDLVATLRHEPGRAMFVDWAGDTIPLVDAAGGTASKAYLFVAALPFSSMVFCRAFADMRIDAWIDAHIGAFAYFGGVTQLVVPDNASTATHRKEKGDAARFVNDRYRQMADHYGVAIVPARVRRPRDKAAVESAVNVVNKRVIGYLLEERWESLAALNEAIDERVHEINHGIRRADDTTRFEVFAADEAPTLAALPAEAFERVEWRQLKAQRNYHVTADYQHYSVPHGLAGQVLRVRLTASRVTVFDGQAIVAEHGRKTGRKGQYSTDPGHVPERHRGIDGLWSRVWFTDRAAAFGPATETVIGQILDRHVIEAQGYLDCQNILSTLGKSNKARLEAACQQLLDMRGYATYSTLKRLAAAIGSDKDKPRPAQAAATNRKPPPGAGPDADVLVRGAGYYADGR